MAEYTALRISELQEATNITDRDLLVINEFSTETGYTLTKKVSAGRLADYVRLRSQDGIKSNLNLKELAYKDSVELLNTFLSGHETYKLPYESLALSTASDLNLGSLAYTDKETLGLDSYVKKHDATRTHVAGSRQYVNGIMQEAGIVHNVTYGNFDSLFPIDKKIDSSSSNAIANTTVAAALDTKVSKDEANASFAPQDGMYVAGLTLQNGTIIAVNRQALPVQAIDNKIDHTSENPVLNKVIAEKLNQLENGITSSAASLYVKKSDANATYTAGNNQYVCSIKLKNGRVSEVLYRSLPTIAVDNAMSTTSTNPVLNKVIANAINAITNTANSANQNIINTIKAIYPAGSIYITTLNSCPLQALGIGTWQLVGSGKCLWCGNGSNAGSTINAGLPSFPTFSATTQVRNSSFTVSGTTSAANTAHSHTFSVPFCQSSGTGPYPYHGGKSACAHSYSGTTNTSSSVNHSHTFSASGTTNVTASTSVTANRVNAVYGNSSTVQPPAYVVNVFRRIS